MKMKCIRNTKEGTRDPFTTINKVYEILGADRDMSSHYYYVIIGDDGEETTRPVSWFAPIPENTNKFDPLLQAKLSTLQAQGVQQCLALNR